MHTGPSHYANKDSENEKMQPEVVVFFFFMRALEEKEKVLRSHLANKVRTWWATAGWGWEEARNSTLCL